MDETRLVRFVTPAFFFIGSILLGAFLMNPRFLDVLGNLEPSVVTAGAAVVVAALFPLGFVITGVSTLGLRLLFKRCDHSYQIRLSPAAWKSVWEVLHLPDTVEKTKANKISAAMTFDHEILEVGTHASAVRLWSVFNISVHSFTAIFFAPIVGWWLFGTCWTAKWLGISGGLLLLFFASAVITWSEQMTFLELQTHRIKDGQMPYQRKKEEEQKA